MRCEKGVLYMTRGEYDGIKEGKGVITSEYTDAETRIRKSFMWNRTLRRNGRMYIEGFNMVIE
jgi:hypothetical protein